MRERKTNVGTACGVEASDATSSRTHRLLLGATKGFCTFATQSIKQRLFVGEMSVYSSRAHANHAGNFPQRKRVSRPIFEQIQPRCNKRRA